MVKLLGIAVGVEKVPFLEIARRGRPTSGLKQAQKLFLRQGCPAHCPGRPTVNNEILNWIEVFSIIPHLNLRNIHTSCLLGIFVLLMEFYHSAS